MGPPPDEDTISMLDKPPKSHPPPMKLYRILQ